jgi:hypothetical protein
VRDFALDVNVERFIRIMSTWSVIIVEGRSRLHISATEKTALDKFYLNAMDLLLWGSINKL